MGILRDVGELKRATAVSEAVADAPTSGSAVTAGTDVDLSAGAVSASSSPRLATLFERDANGELSATLLTIAVDFLTIVLAFLSAFWLRVVLGPWLGLVTIPKSDEPVYASSSVVVAFLCVLVLGRHGLYGRRRIISLSDELVNVTRAVSMSMLVLLSVAFFYQEFKYSRLVLSLFWAFSIVTVFCGRAAILSLERRQYRVGKNLRKAIILGNNGSANNVYRELDGHEAFGVGVFGYFADAPTDRNLELAEAPHLGNFDDAARCLRTEDIDLVLIAVDAWEHPRVNQLVSECVGTNIEFMMVPDMSEILANRVKIKEIGRIPFLRMRGAPLSSWDRVLKRVFDIFVSAVLLVLLSPLLAVTALLVRLTSPGPILFRQNRIGLVGEQFTIYKFRSMRVGAESTDKEAGLGIRDDPRRTAFGAFLRRTSLDELPQLFNVLKGDMSLVGPRPERTHCVDEFRHEIPKYLDRHRVKTGITGWAQVNGLRGDTSLQDRIKADLYYIENWSLAFDIRILIRTLRAVVEG